MAYRNPNEYKRDMSLFYTNIDTLFKSMRETQEELGVEPTIEYAVKDEDSGRRFKRFQKRSEEEEKIYQRAKQKMEADQKKKDDSSEVHAELDENGLPTMKHIRDRLNGIRADGDDDDDGLYICEYCSALGYRQKYNPIICDQCVDCSECAEFSDGVCSGCSYSIYREGRPYSDFLSLNEMISNDDLNKFNKVQTGNMDGKIRGYDINFDVDDL